MVNKIIKVLLVLLFSFILFQTISFGITYYRARGNGYTYLACGCGCCVGEIPTKQCLYKSKGESLAGVIRKDLLIKKRPICNTVGCSFGTLYSYCD